MLSGTDLLPPIYYINLDRRSDRRAHMESQFAELGLAAQRISAVAVSTIPPSELEQHCNPNSVRAVSRSQLACTMSHMRAWQTLLQTGADWGLIFEDDVLISPRLPQFLSDFFSKPELSSLDLVHIEATARRARVLPVATTLGDIGLRPFCSTQWGSAGYLVSVKAARALLIRQDVFEGPVDRFLFRPYTAPGKDLNLSLADPALCIQINKTEASDLAQGNLTPVVSTNPTPLSIRLLRLWRDAPPFLASVAYHLNRLKGGVSRKIIPFDTPAGMFSGSRLEGYGQEIVD